MRYYKGRYKANASFDLLQGKVAAEDAKKIREDLVEEIAFVFKRRASIELLWKSGMAALNSALSRTVEEIVLAEHIDWERDKKKYIRMLSDFTEV